jgi:hypothetical protein
MQLKGNNGGKEQKQKQEKSLKYKRERGPSKQSRQGIERTAEMGWLVKSSRLKFFDS